MHNTSAQRKATGAAHLTGPSTTQTYIQDPIVKNPELKIIDNSRIILRSLG